jgi:hypothetical protein
VKLELSKRLISIRIKFRSKNIGRAYGQRTPPAAATLAVGQMALGNYLLTAISTRRLRLIYSL